MKTYAIFDEAKKEALFTGLPLWDTHTLPIRYVVGHLSTEAEDDPDNSEWTQVILDQD